MTTSAYLSEAEVSERLHEFEVRYDALRLRFNGWCAWPLVRNNVWRALQNKPLDRSTDPAFGKAELARIAAADIFRVLRSGRASYLVRTHSSFHSEMAAGRRKDVTCDDVLLRVPGGVKLERINSREFFCDSTRRLIPTRLTTATVGLIARRFIRWKPPGLQDTAALLSHEVQKGLGLSSFSCEYVSNCLLEFYWMKKAYRGLLRWLRVRAVLVVTSDIALTAAARELGLACGEIQHGVVHRGYPPISWTTYATAHKATMPLPQRVLLYGEYWREEYAALGFWDEELRVVGSTRIDRYRAEKTVRDKNICTMVVTTQGTDTDRLITFLSDFLQCIPRNFPFRLIIKRHPYYDASDRAYREVFGMDGRTEVLSGTSRPTTFELLKRCHLHASIDSTCHFEALALSVPTIVLPLRGSENMKRLTESGDAVLADTPRQLAATVCRWRELKVSADSAEAYFAGGADERMKREVESLLTGEPRESARDGHVR
jgi:hypothetical protein